jgi:hypothetical protein
MIEHQRYHITKDMKEEDIRLCIESC